MARFSNSSSRAVVSSGGSGSSGSGNGSSSAVLSRALSSSRVSVRRFPHRLHRGAPSIMPATPVVVVGDRTITLTLTRRALSAPASTPEDDDDDDEDGGGSRSSLFSVVEEGTERYLVAARDLRPGEVLFDRAGGKVSDEITRHSIQVGPQQHVLVDGELVLMNHSCEPSCQLEVLRPSSSADKVSENFNFHQSVFFLSLSLSLSFFFFSCCLL